MSNEDNSLQQVVKPIYEQIEGWNYELEELPQNEKFMLDGVTPRVMVSGILQKAETLNQNKRVYPIAILKREVDNYQKLIEEKRAFGECVDRETSICTVKDGWKSIADVKEGELIYTLNTENNNIHIEPVLFKTDREHKNDVLHIYNKSGTIDMVLTEDHKMLIYDRKGNPFYIKASKLEKMFLEKDPVINKWSIRGSGKFIYETYIDESEISCIDIQNLRIDRKEFDDNVYCVTTGNGNWLAQRKGKMFWTGNCDHPEASVIELKNVSHVIRKTWWEGNDLYGRVEVLNTTAGKVVREIINAGLTLGISSRGVGSTRNEGGVDVVQEDFMLICWDFVSEPSTPGAFMFRESKEPAISRNLAENAFKNWGVDIKDKVYYDGLVEDQHKLNLCKNANSIIEYYNKIKG